MARYTVRCPVSKQVLRLAGQLYVGDVGGGLFAVGIIPEDPAEAVVMVDPRYTISEGGRVVYRPEDFYEELDEAMRAWMDEQGRGPTRAGEAGHGGEGKT